MPDLKRYTATPDPAARWGLRIAPDPAGRWVKADELDSPPLRLRLRAEDGVLLIEPRPDGAWCTFPDALTP